MAAERQRECADDHEEQLQHASIVAGIGAKINGTSFGEPQPVVSPIGYMIG